MPHFYPNSMNLTYKFLPVLFLLFILAQAARLHAQPKYFTETFDKNAGWKLSNATHPDSAHFEIKGGSLILTNKQRNAGMVELTMPFYGELDQDAEWQLQFTARHLDGANNYNYGICQGSKPGTYFTDGLSIGLTGNGYFRMDTYFGKKKSEIKTWTQFSHIQTADSSSNEVRIIYRAPWGFFVLINNHWAYMGRGGGREGKTLTLFAEGNQTIAFDDIRLVSYRGQYTKMADVRAQELKEICAVAVDSFSRGRGFANGDEYKTWLPEMFICNRDYKIFRRTEGVFPKRVGKGAAHYVYDINVDYLSAADRDAKIEELAALIKTVLGQVKESKATLGNKTLRYFFCKNPEFPKGTIVILGEYAFRREYETVDHYYIEFMVLNAPGIKPF